jgi:hypothetical protein
MVKYRLFISLFCLVTVVLLMVQNWSQTTSVTLGSQHWPAVSVGTLLLGVVLLTSVSLLLRFMDLATILRNRMQQDTLRREKAQVVAETSSDQVCALEAKINTLEKALEQALSSSRA